MNRIVSLEPFTKKHIDKTFSWVSCEELQQSFMMRGAPDQESNNRYWQKVLSDSLQKVFAVSYQGEHVGNCGIRNLSNVKKTAELWMYIGSISNRKKGIGTAALFSLIEKVRDDFGLKILYLYVNKRNAPARKMYSKAGFEEVEDKQISQVWGTMANQINKMELRLS